MHKPLADYCLPRRAPWCLQRGGQTVRAECERGSSIGEPTLCAPAAVPSIETMQSAADGQLATGRPIRTPDSGEAVRACVHARRYHAAQSPANKPNLSSMRQGGGLRH